MAMVAAENAGLAPHKDPMELWIFWAWLAGAWGILFWAASYGWRFAEYYDHGWFVPPLAGWMLWRRIGALGPARPERMFPLWLLGVLVAVALLVIAPLRVLERVDPRWVLPLWTHGMVVAALTHGLVARNWGLRASGQLVPWTMLALSALALPTLLERGMVTNLTQLVLAATQQVLALFGMLADVSGDRLLVDGKDVTVTEGCSGIRSGLAFLMAALFFGEWMSLRWSRRAAMLGLALATAWAVNVARATALAVVHFEGASGALDAWHDNIGFLSYIFGSGILLGISAWLEKGQHQRPAKVVTRIRKQA